MQCIEINTDLTDIIHSISKAVNKMHQENQDLTYQQLKLLNCSLGKIRIDEGG